MILLLLFLLIPTPLPPLCPKSSFPSRMRLKTSSGINQVTPMGMATGLDQCLVVRRSINLLSTDRQMDMCEPNLRSIASLVRRPSLSLASLRYCSSG